MEHNNISLPLNHSPAGNNNTVTATNPNPGRPVLNYSIQTGEEFALEFMRERLRSVPETNPSLPATPETGTTRDPVITIPVLTSSRNNASSKLLCSYGGRVLPRPSDGKLRYVGGETKILRIPRDASWVDLKKRTFSLYGGSHAIKYQLPGEDLEALITVSSDEDVHNMMEECGALEGTEERLRMFLFSNELEESQQLSREVEFSEAEYVVAVNGMDFGSRRNSVALESHLSQSVDGYLIGSNKETKNRQSLAETEVFSLPPVTRQEETRGRTQLIIQENDSHGEGKHEGAGNVSAGDESNKHHEDGFPQLKFHSERLHREQWDTNRLSKSGDYTNMKAIANPMHDVVEKENESLNSNGFRSSEKPVVQMGTDPIKSSRREEDDKAFIGAAKSGSGDILIDISDRFPRDFLSEMFFGDLPQQPSDFKTDRSRLDFSLMDQDHHHHAFTSAQRNTDAKVKTDNRDSNSRASSSSAKKPEAIVPQSVQQSNRPINSRIPGSDYEADKGAAQPKQIPLLDLSHEALQIIKNTDLEELRELGSGTYGTVYHGKWRGSDVAIKRIKKSCFMGPSSEQEKLSADFWHEANILSKLHHPNVVAFYGVVRDGPGGTLATVTEYMVNGSLRRALVSKERHLNRHKRLLIAMDAAFGMEYLHSRNIVHFDLKCDNLLANLKDPSRPVCKVGDFGLSKIKRNTLVTGGVRGTLPWMAPELLSGSSNKVSEKVDVFSFGIVLWEILTGEEPYANMHYGAIIGGIVNNTLRPPIPGYCDPDWRLLMEQCWAPDPRDRPNFTYIARQLRRMSDACSPKAPHGGPAQNQQPKS